MIGSASRLYHTVVHLKPVQIYGRPIYKLRQPKPRLGRAPSPRSLGGAWNSPIEKAQNLYGPRLFRLLGREGGVGSAADWNSPYQEKLWLYNLHYFDDLTAKDAADRTRWHRELVDCWIADNPVAHGNGWEAYPVSLRIVNWIKWAFEGADFESHWLESLAVQARWLERRVEWHLLGNHLFANAKALIFAGLFFDGPEAAHWLKRGLSILAAQLVEQVLADGGHFELSPMYHSIILEDVLDLINIARTFPGAVPEGILSHLQIISDKMRRWLGCMTHPDGRIAFFNDAAFGIAADRSAIEDYARRLGLGSIPEPKEESRNWSSPGTSELDGVEPSPFSTLRPSAPIICPAMRMPTRSRSNSRLRGAASSSMAALPAMERGCNASASVQRRPTARSKSTAEIRAKSGRAFA